jgi:hypothetical protein
MTSATSPYSLQSRPTQMLARAHTSTFTSMHTIRGGGSFCPQRRFCSPSRRVSLKESFHPHAEGGSLEKPPSTNLNTPPGGAFPHLGLYFGFIYRTQPRIATGDGPTQHTARTHLMPNSTGSSHPQELQTLETLVIFFLDTGVATHL